jgi:hypothetical protein
LIDCHSLAQKDNPPGDVPRGILAGGGRAGGYLANIAPLSAGMVTVTVSLPSSTSEPDSRPSALVLGNQSGPAMTS